MRRANDAAVIGSSVALCAAMLFGIASAPVAARFAPLTLNEFAQPLPAAPVLPHGQAVPEPSPKQYGVPVEPGPQFARRSQ